MRTRILLTMAGFLAALPLSAERITLEEALAAARTNNGDIKVATLTLAKTQRENAVSDWLPSVSLSLGANMSGSIINDTYSASADYTLAQINWSYNPATHANNRESRSLSNESALLSYQSSLNSVESSVTTAYWNTQAAKLALQSAEDTLRQENEELETVQAKYDAGKTSSLTLSQQKLSVSDASYTVEIDRQSLDSCLRTLKNLTGLDWKTDTELDAMPEDFALKSTDQLEAGLTKTVTMQKAALSIQQAQNQLTKTKRSVVAPTVSVSAKTSLGGGIFSYTSKDDDVVWFNDSKKLADSTTISASVTIPLDHFMKDSEDAASLDGASYQIQIAQQEYLNTLDDLTEKVGKAVDAIEKARQNLAKLKEHQALAEEQLSLIQQSYDAGKSSYRDLSDAKDKVTDAGLSVIQQQLNHTIALYDLAILLECPVSDLSAQG